MAVVILQETQRTTDDNLTLPGFLHAGSIPSKHHGMATFVRTGITWSAVKRSPPDSNIEWQVTEVQETTIVNVYKPPPSERYPTSLPSVSAPAYAGDFNSQNTDWGFKQTTKDGEMATALLHKLDEVRRARWIEVVEYVDFTHSSRKAWQIINKLTGRSTTHSRCPVTANAIASQLLNNGRFPNADRDFARWTSREVTSLSRAATADTNLSSDFTVEELEAAIKMLNSGKAPGRDNIHPEFIIHQSAKTTAWLCSFLTSCFRRSKLPNTCRRATVVALPQPNKTAQDPKSYSPISLICAPFKILERLIHSSIDSVVDPQLPREQAGFRRGRSTGDQVTLLTQYTDNSFQHNEKYGSVSGLNSCI